MYRIFKLNEAEDDEEIIDNIEDTEEANEELQDTVADEENQEENPVEEDNLLDNQLNELRDVLVDLDLNLYRIASKEDPNNVIYIIGKVAENSNDVLMLVDNKPEEINNEIELNTPIADDIKTDEVLEDDEEVTEPTEEDTTEDENRFDFVVLPKSFDEINKLNPRYGEDLTPDHEAIMDYLMNCLIEVNPEAAEELQNQDEEVPEEIADDNSIETPIDVDVDEDLGEEDLEDED